MGAHVSAVPNHQTGRTTPFYTRCNVAMGGNFGFELDLTKLSPEDIACARENIARVKELRQTMQQGVFSRLLDPAQNGGNAAWQTADEDRVVVCVYQQLAAPNPAPWHVKLTGLDENAKYTDREHGITASGAALMNIGLPLQNLGGDFESRIYCFEKM
jgi:alpha-galactosidase